MADPGDMARSGAVFEAQLRYAINQQEPAVAERLWAEFASGNCSVEQTDRGTILVRIAGVEVMEATLYAEPKDVRSN